MTYEFEYETHAYNRVSIEAHSQEEAFEKFFDRAEGFVAEAQEKAELVDGSLVLAEVYGG